MFIQVDQDILDARGNFAGLASIRLDHPPTHREQRGLRPGLEPVNHSRGDGGQEALGADAEILTNRRAAEDHVEVGLDLHDEGRPAVLSRVHEAEGLGLTTHGIDNLILVLLSWQMKVIC